MKQIYLFSAQFWLKVQISFLYHVMVDFSDGWIKLFQQQARGTRVLKPSQDHTLSRSKDLSLIPTPYTPTAPSTLALETKFLQQELRVVAKL